MHHVVRLELGVTADGPSELLQQETGNELKEFTSGQVGENEKKIITDGSWTVQISFKMNSHLIPLPVPSHHFAKNKNALFLRTSQANPASMITWATNSTLKKAIIVTYTHANIICKANINYHICRATKNI